MVSRTLTVRSFGSATPGTKPTLDDVEPFLDTAFGPAFGNGTIDPPYTTTRPPSHQWIERTDIGEMFVRRERMEQALTQATWLLNTLTGGKLHGVECWQENYDVHSCEIKLRRGPVINIHRVQKVKQCGRWIEAQTEVEDFCIVRPGVISFCCNCSYSQWSCGCTNTVRVDYQIDSNLPPGTGVAVAWLAAEYMKAFDGKACALPGPDLQRHPSRGVVDDPRPAGLLGEGPHRDQSCRSMVGNRETPDW